MLGEGALGLVCELLGRVSRVCELAQAMGLPGMRLGVLDHPVDVVLREAGAALDADLLLVARAEVLSPTR